MGIQSKVRALRDGRVQETLPRLAWEEHLAGAPGPSATQDKERPAGLQRDQQVMTSKKGRKF